MLNEYYLVPLIKNYNHETILEEMSRVFGPQGENWFIYNRTLYLRDNTTYTWFMLKYG